MSLLLAAALTVATNFEAGSVGKVEFVTPTHLRCPIVGESDQDKRNHQPSWFYFRLDGAAGRDLTIDITAWNGEYNYRPHKGEGARNTRPVYSADGITWRHFDSAEWIPDASTLRLRIRPAGPRLFIARQAPYTNQHLERLLADISRHPHFRQEAIGQTVGGRPMRLLTITDPAAGDAARKVIWLMARQHAWESGTSWVAEGLLRWLLSSDPEAARIRTRFIVKMFPMADPDGVARGGVRYNAHGYDLNRNWDVVDAQRMPEIAAQRKAVFDWLDAGRRIDFFLTLHNTESEDYIGSVAELQPLAARFLRQLLDTSTFHSPRGVRVEPPTTTAGLKGRMTVYQGLFAERQVPAFLMEQMVDSSPRLGHPPTVDDRLGFGPLLLRAICATLAPIDPVREFPNIPPSYLQQPSEIPPFWVTTLEDVNRFLDTRVRKGRVETIGLTAGGRPIRAVFYGTPRQGQGTSTFSGSLGFRDVRAFLGPDSARKVYLGLAAVHGGEFEAIAGMVNLISVVETGQDLRGKAWPEITAAAEKLDRLILVPIVNADGRARVPLRMHTFHGSDYTVSEYFNTGAKADGSIIGWPQVKEFIPLDFSKSQFPGGYPNDAGVNIQHDDFLGRRQPETQALLDLVARERPDLILNLHTGAVYPLMHRPLIEPVLMKAWEQLFARVQGRLAIEGLQRTRDPLLEADHQRKSPQSDYNLDTALNLHSGALSTVIESPSHAFTGAKVNNELRPFSVSELVDAQLFIHLEAQKFLAETGGRLRWQALK